MEIGAQEPRLGQWSQVYADGKRMTREGPAWCFNSQPVGAVFFLIKSPPDHRRSRTEQD